MTVEDKLFLGSHAVGMPLVNIRAFGVALLQIMGAKREAVVKNVDGDGRSKSLLITK